MLRFVFVALSLCYTACSYNYCQQERDCPNGQRHIGCHPEHLGIKFNNVTKIPLSRKLRNLILETHNDYRNQLACGMLDDIHKIPYPPGAKMRELMWDMELEYLASLHVEHCTIQSDECRITSRYKFVGQSVGSLSGSLPSVSGFHIGAATKELLTEWLNQHKVSSYINAKKFQNEPETGEFHQMINDRVSRIGCALSLCHFKNKDNIFLLTCNYSYRNQKDEEVYTSGPIVTKCDRVNSRPSRKFRCLCEASDV